MAPKKRTTRASQATTTTTTTPVANAQLKTLIDQGIADALAARDADSSMNGDDSHNSRMGVVGFMQWFKKMETIFHICNCTIACQIKFVTCTQQEIALTWWNSYVKIVTHDIAYAMTWKTLKKMMTDMYCPRGKIKKLKIEMWNMKVKGTDVVSYNQRFQKLLLMCSRMFPEELDEIEKYVGGLHDMIHRSVMASKPKTMQDAVKFATKLIDKKTSTLVERIAENNKKIDNNNQAQQQPPKKMFPEELDEIEKYVGGLPDMIHGSVMASKLKTMQDAIEFSTELIDKKISTLAERISKNNRKIDNNNQDQQKPPKKQGPYKSDCPKLKNRNHGNQAEGTGAWNGKMAPKKRTTRASPATTTTTTTPVTNALLKAFIDPGFADALPARDADRSMNGDDNHNSGMGSRRT
uniref:Retrotransposon gag domain-containing protein n=1 Tax=Tanacetum cinerariifolium TaxID=118510 RepID=A0A6L2LZP5_TANCI|nr:hypothetical protein [Tanacetum cinerariifolium]